MPRIDDQLLQCVVYLYPDRPKAAAGEGYGGSGFLIGLRVEGFEDRVHVVFVATNRHVARNGNSTIRINTVDGGIDIIELDDRSWLYHPGGDDLAIAPLGGLKIGHHQCLYLSPDIFLSDEIIRQFSIGPGDDCYIIGRFINHDGKQRNAPSVRFGSIAQMPGEKIRFDDGSEQESFLVEARSIAGYSGSPVFVEIPPWSGAAAAGRPNSNLRYGPWLLGIDHCHLFSREWVREAGSGKPVNKDWHVRSNTGMMGVVPAWKLAELLDSPDIQSLMEREKEVWQEYYTNQQSGAERD